MGIGLGSVAQRRTAVGVGEHGQREVIPAIDAIRSVRQLAIVGQRCRADLRVGKLNCQKNCADAKEAAEFFCLSERTFEGLPCGGVHFVAHLSLAQPHTREF